MVNQIYINSEFVKNDDFRRKYGGQFILQQDHFYFWEGLHVLDYTSSFLQNEHPLLSCPKWEWKPLKNGFLHMEKRENSMFEFFLSMYFYNTMR